MMHEKFDNPFDERTPDSLSSSDAAKLFVDVYTDFHKVKEAGHTFIHGPRGTGKSMMLRYLEPDVQIAAGNVENYKQLEYYAVHIPIKKAWSDITEWRLLTGSSYYVIAEHVMASHIMFMTFNSFKKSIGEDGFKNETKLYQFVDRLLRVSGHEGLQIGPGEQFLEKAKELFETEFLKIKQFLKRLIYRDLSSVPYEGAIFSYLDFVVPILSYIKELGIYSKGPFFLLVDDADQLDEGMQKILNTWVSCRTVESVCLKIATQMRYKTYRTIDNKLIETPHDYSEVNVGTIYTRSGSKYLSRISEIVEKRLRLVNIHSSAVEFFPEDEAQSKEIENVRQEILQLREKGEGLGGNRAYDDLIRHTIPIYMSRLAGKSKSSASFSYAGFKSLVDLSSGVIRWFLDPAAKMYSEAISLSDKRVEQILDNNGRIKCIPVDVQDKVIKDWSFDFIDSEFPKLRRSGKSGNEGEFNERSSSIVKLFNLISGLGELFRAKLLDESSSERKLSSILVADEIPEELEDILQMGVELGYLQKTSIGSKEGRGRKPRYTLSRRLAPYFKLDPSGYAYSLSVTSGALTQATLDPKGFVRDRLQKGASAKYLAEEKQQSLDF